MKQPLAAESAAQAARAALPVAGRVGVAVLGASGYVGAELVRLLAEHPGASLRALAARQNAGQRFVEVWPGLPHVDFLLDHDEATDPAAWRERGVEVVFAALPHGAFAARAAAFLDAGLGVIDLSADFRLRAAADYRRRHHQAHPAAQLLAGAVYGLSEWCGPELAAARLVANPGCYATAVLLAVLPAVAAGWWSGAPIVVNALSGVSGAGRTPSLATHFVECGNSAAPYKVGEEHAHLAEMQQALGAVLAASAAGVAAAAPSGGAARAPRAADGEAASDTPDHLAGCMVFNPHLVPMARGIVASVALPLGQERYTSEAQGLYERRYAPHPFVRVLAGAALPETRHVRGSNRCDLAVRVVAGGRMLLVFAAIDNLVKGAAGQAIQNWNRMQGWPETTGLPIGGWPCA